MKRKISNTYRNIKKVAAHVQSHGIRATLNKVQLHLQYRNQSLVYDFISLKPVRSPWKSKQNLAHGYKMSVIIPTYNRAHMLPQLLECWKEVDRATKYSYEIIFSDDGSNDDSIEILEKETQLPLKILKNEHGGAAKARNAAVRAAEGEKLLIIGSRHFPQ